MHAERYDVPRRRARALRGPPSRVVAVGTTVVRALESAARGGPTGRTDLFIHGDFEFRVVDRLLTNFHVPRSSLLVLVDAFVGPAVAAAVRHAPWPRATASSPSATRCCSTTGGAGPA